MKSQKVKKPPTPGKRKPQIKKSFEEDKQLPQAPSPESDK
jgi:hypothetical protein